MPSDDHIRKLIKKERKAKGLTLADMHEETGISIPTLSKIENGNVGLNFEHLSRISGALSKPIVFFMSDTSSMSGARRVITKAGEGQLNRTKDLQYESLCDGMTNTRNLFWRLSIDPSPPGKIPKLRQHPGEEFIYVLSGVFVLHSKDYKPLELKVGDSTYFDGSSPHGYAALGNEPAVILMINSTDTIVNLKS